MESGDIVYSSIAGSAVSKFCMMLFLSAIIGVLFGLVSAIVSYVLPSKFSFYVPK